LPSIKKAGIVATSTFAMVAGFSMVASPAFANTCTGPVGTTAVYVNTCADVETYDADPAHAGFGVRAAASMHVHASGDTYLCTGTHGAGVNLDPTTPLIVEPDVFSTGLLVC
jgi:hypothetical protein